MNSNKFRLTGLRRGCEVYEWFDSCDDAVVTAVSWINSNTDSPTTESEIKPLRVEDNEGNLIIGRSNLLALAVGGVKSA